MDATEAAAKLQAKMDAMYGWTMPDNTQHEASESASEEGSDEDDFDSDIERDAPPTSTKEQEQTNEPEVVTFTRTKIKPLMSKQEQRKFMSSIITTNKKKAAIPVKLVDDDDDMLTKLTQSKSQERCRIAGVDPEHKAD
jgi:hypothetical protein